MRGMVMIMVVAMIIMIVAMVIMVVMAVIVSGVTRSVVQQIGAGKVDHQAHERDDNRLLKSDCDWLKQSYNRTRNR
jgi:hypothetical protein